MEIGIFIGTVTFVGSVIACMKLAGKFRKLSRCMQSIVNHAGMWNILLLIIAIVLMVLSGLTAYNESCIRAEIPPVLDIDNKGWIFNLALVIISIFYGIIFVLPIGGADMPVVISV